MLLYSSVFECIVVHLEQRAETEMFTIVKPLYSVHYYCKINTFVFYTCSYGKSDTTVNNGLHPMCLLKSVKRNNFLQSVEFINF